MSRDSVFDDLSDLPSLDEATILQELHRRALKQKKYYTYVGEILVALNPYSSLDIYNDEFHLQYTNVKARSCLPPHIFWVADQAVSRMCQSGLNQSIILSGESGSGKTENAKHAIKHIAYLCQSDQADLQNKIIQVNPLLEAFGNARTALNDNSSRFGKLTQLKFTAENKLLEAEIGVYMLEKIRVVSQQDGDRNFHVFYNLFCGLDANRLNALNLGSIKDFRILQGVSLNKNERKKYKEEFIMQELAMRKVGFSDKDIDMTYAILSAVLHVTNISFVECDDETERVDISERAHLIKVCSLLGVSETDLRTALITRTARTAGETVVMNKNRHHAESGRDALGKTLYVRMFDWLVKQINTHLQASQPTSYASSISIFDISGFENVERNGFEQLCINFGCEKLQQLFNDHVFNREKEECKSEGIDWIHIQYESNAESANLLEEKMGFFPLLDEQTLFPRATDETLVLRLDEALGRSQAYERVATSRLSFIIHHFAGKVVYQAQGFLEKNREKLSKNLIRVLKHSKNDVIKGLFESAGHEGDAIFDSYHPGVHAAAIPFGVRDTHGMFFNNGHQDDTGGYNNSSSTRTVTKQYRHSLSQMLNRLKDSKCLFVRCILPNRKRKANHLVRDEVAEQVRHCGLLGVARIRQAGFPVRYYFKQFAELYGALYRRGGHDYIPADEVCKTILSRSGLHGYAMGKTKVYMKQNLKDQLDKRLNAVWNSQAKIIQNTFKTYKANKAQKEDKQLKGQVNAEKDAKTPPDPAPSEVNSSHSKNKAGKAPRKPSNINVSKTGDLGYASARGSIESNGEETPQHDVRAAATQGETDVKIPVEDDDSRSPWDVFQMIPRDRISANETYSGFITITKLVFFFLLFCVVISACVVNKISLVILTSNLHVLRTNPNNIKVDNKARNQGVTMLLLCVCAPYAFTVVLNVMKIFFGRYQWPSARSLFLVLLVDLFQSAGVYVITFIILPHLDMVRAVLMLCGVGIVPVTCKLFFGTRPNFPVKVKVVGWYLAHVFAFLVQITAFIWVMFSDFQFDAKRAKLQSSSNMFLYRSQGNQDSAGFWWQVPFGLLFTSLLWWENFIDNDVKLGKNIIPVLHWKTVLEVQRQKTAIISGLFKIGILIIFSYWFNEGFRLDLITFGSTDHVEKQAVMNYAPLVLNVTSGLIGYFVASLACKLRMQKFGFSLPLLLATPVTIILLVCQCHLDFLNTTSYFWFCPEGIKTETVNDSYWQFILCFAVWLSQMIIAAHIWKPKQERLASLENLFVRPMYCGTLLEQSLLFNRKRHDRNIAKIETNVNDVESGSSNEGKEELTNAGSDDDVTPMIYACATMWHETRDEMTQLLKSLFRMDVDQAARKNAQKLFNIKDPDCYEFEAHILFDDAMELNDDEEYVPNDFVKLLMEVVDEAASSVHECAISLPPPTKTPTPYGGKLTWTLPGECKMVVHLKDKQKIRHRKRWSQCMYLYYLLGYKLFAADTSDTTTEEQTTQSSVRRRSKAAGQRSNSHFTQSDIFKTVEERIHLQADNTFILALDGDVDFKPDAVRLLVDRMKKNKKVGATCGRIHPTGTGPMVWYQVFEYAIGHWMQKAAEHVFGCVLCCPGCFSLYRASALMDDNVMRTYTKRATEAVEFLQYDQGEDRWLCTLLLQQGYRVEYCAASDALTHAPETFNEFFNQRRRWLPSTMANVIDLLSSYEITIKANDSISLPYIIYIFLLFVTSVLAPATIVMLIAGSFNTVIGTDLWQSFMLSLAPVFFFMAICFKTQTKTQLAVAAAMSSLYAVVMMIVIVGTIVNAFSESLTSPNVIFLLILVAQFTVAGLVHPQEIACLSPGLLFFICIPSSYLLLTIYALCNMHVVSWGTREVPKKRTRAEVEKEKRIEEQKKQQKLKKGKGIVAWLGITSLLSDLKEYSLQMMGGGTQSSNLDRPKTDELLVEIKKTLEQLLHAVKKDGLDPKNNSNENVQIPCSASTSGNEGAKVADSNGSATNIDGSSEQHARSEEPSVCTSATSNSLTPKWATEKSLGKGLIKQIDSKEDQFWKRFITTYLHPLPPDTNREKKQSQMLIELRNNAVFGFSMINLLWLVIIFQLQILKEELEGGFFIPIPRFDNPEEFQRFEPLGFVFLLFFAVILTLQFLAMLYHRWGTLLHIIAITEIEWPCVRHPTTTNKNESLIKLAHEMQSLKNADYVEDNPDYELADIDEGVEDAECVECETYQHVNSNNHPYLYNQNHHSRALNGPYHNYFVQRNRRIKPGTLSRVFQHRVNHFNRDKYQLVGIRPNPGHFRRNRNFHPQLALYHT